MRELKYIVLSLLMIALAVGLRWYNDYAMPRHSAEVLRVYDGDTFTANIKSKDGVIERNRVRIRDIDTPEIKGKCALEIRKANEAKEALIALIDNKLVTLKDIGSDRYDRTLATAYNYQNINIGRELVKTGYARAYDRHRRSWCD